MYNQNDLEGIKKLLIGKTVLKISETELLLNDGTILELEGNEGCGGCNSGWYTLDYLNDCPDNMITNVFIESTETDTNDDYEIQERYTIFVLATDQKLMTLAKFNGTDGNGYYGTGFHINIRA